MNLQTIQQWLKGGGNVFSGLAAPLLVMSVLALMVLPIAPWMLDGFFSLNIAVSLVVI